MMSETLYNAICDTQALHGASPGGADVSDRSWLWREAAWHGQGMDRAAGEP